MNILKDDLIAVLSQFNPWWRGEAIADLPLWQRGAFHELFNWVYQPPVKRAVLLSGARQVGKTTLLLQVIDALLQERVSPSNILYATFDHPIIKMAGIDAVLSAWREREPKAAGAEYLFLDEAQFMREHGTWVKHQVDFVKDRRIVFTGSAMPLLQTGTESGVGRWHTIRLPTLSFYEYLQLKPRVSLENIGLQQHGFSTTQLYKMAEDLQTLWRQYPHLYSPSKLTAELPKLPSLASLADLFNWPQQEFYRVAELAIPYVGHFHEYLLRGGFPQTAQIESIPQAQRLLREDIIDKVLKRDMTALFGVRRVLDLEQTFLYLCMHDGGLLDMTDLCSNLAVKRPTAQHFIELLEATHLIYRLQPYGYGKDILRGKYKIYLADPAIAPAVLLKGKSLLEDASTLGITTETAVFKHIYTYYAGESVRLSYWRGTKDHEVDIVAEAGEHIIPFEVKYRSQHTGLQQLKGLLELCQKNKIAHAYIITKSITDFGLLANVPNSNTRIMRIPAPLFCYWLGEIGGRVR